MITAEDKQAMTDYLVRVLQPLERKSGIVAYANRQQAATLTFDVEIDWSHGLDVQIELAFGIGFQVVMVATLIIE